MQQFLQLGQRIERTVAADAAHDRESCADLRDLPRAQACEALSPEKNSLAMISSWASGGVLLNSNFGASARPVTRSVAVTPRPWSAR